MDDPTGFSASHRDPANPNIRVFWTFSSPDFFPQPFFTVFFPAGIFKRTESQLQSLVLGLGETWRYTGVLCEYMKSFVIDDGGLGNPSMGSPSRTYGTRKPPWPWSIPWTKGFIEFVVPYSLHVELTVAIDHSFTQCEQ